MASLGCCTSLLFLLLSLVLSGVLADDAAAITTMTVNVLDYVDEKKAEDSLSEEMRDQAMTMRKFPTNATSTETPFMPSIHLGPIASSDQQRQTTKLSPFNVGPLLFPDEHKKSPFNSLSAIKFGQSKDNPPLKASSSPKPEKPLRPSERDGNFVKVVEDKQNSKENCSPAPKISKNQRQGEPIYHQHVTYVADPSLNPQSASYSEESYDNGYQQQYANYETKPTKYDVTPVVYGTPYHQAPIVQSQSGHIEPHYHHSEALVTKPEMVINFQHPMAFQAASYDSKPKTVIYVSQEPHQFYRQPPVFNHLETPPEHEETYPIYYDQPPYKGLSPWKKILHIIGAFIPLGLLFALLPSILKPNTNPNTNNPSIVLSKLRVNDLTPEHKHDRLVALDTECREERSICRLLSAADNTGFDFLKNIVQRIAEKTAESSVRKKELDRIFEAAKLGNCDILTCDFYDGT